MKLNLDCIYQILCCSELIEFDKSPIKTLIEKIANFFDSDIIEIFTGFTAIIGFAMSIINFYTDLKSKKKKFTVQFKSINNLGFYISSENKKYNVIKIKYVFSNKSHLPISITRIRMAIGYNYFDSETYQYIAEQFTNQETGEISHQTKTSTLPICLDALGASSGYLAFLLPSDTLSTQDTNLTFEICTNRGRKIKRTFILNEEYIIKR